MTMKSSLQKGTSMRSAFDAMMWFREVEVRRRLLDCRTDIRYDVTFDLANGVRASLVPETKRDEMEDVAGSASAGPSHRRVADLACGILTILGV
jgi:hypothetical protein